MSFDIKRKGYCKEQVDAYIQGLVSTSAQKDERIAELNTQVATLKEELGKLEGKRELIVKAIYSAIAKAEQIEQLTKAKYDAEMARLKAFHEKWTEYYNKLLAKYPMDDELMAVSKFNKEMTETLNAPQKQFKSEEARLKSNKIGSVEISSNEPFDPVKSIKEYLDGESDATAATRPRKGSKAYKTGIAVMNPALSEPSDTGFNFEEALNPTEDLKDIMKDLGLLGE
ncbi:MAG: hypothetical protein J1F36_06425 [Clostridiales bacterium]|nr:hypothetical protein [Clostridiales bacterium]